MNSGHFSEGILAVREWNYIFNFYTGEGTEYLTCQYKAVFDREDKVASYHWRTPECAAFVRPPAVAEIDDATGEQSIPLVLSGDALFAFGKGGVDDLTPGGQQSIAQLANSLKTNFTKIQSIRIVGHTDRVGKEQANRSLSYLRASTVKKLLVELGIPGELIETEGQGATAPLVACDGEKVTPELVRCLQPNRRVEIMVKGS